MALSTLTFSAAGSRMDDVGSSFAYDLAKRISRSKGLDSIGAANPADSASTPAVDAEQAAAQTEKQSQLRKLESALSSTVSYMKEKHGEQAASAMIGIVYKTIGNGEIDETSLGNAFLDVTRFIDRNFGTDSGDAFMAHLNGNLNDSMNAFFDNGMNETFMVAPPPGGSAGGGIDAAGLLESITTQYTEMIKEMLEEARTNPETATGPYAETAPKDAMVGVLKDVMV